MLPGAANQTPVRLKKKGKGERRGRERENQIHLLNRPLAHFKEEQNKTIEYTHKLYSRSLECHQHEGIYILTKVLLCFFTITEDIPSNMIHLQKIEEKTNKQTNTHVQYLKDVSLVQCFEDK